MKWNEVFTMKRMRALALIFGCFLILGLYSVQAEQPCTLATLSGSYAFTNTGFLTEPFVNPNEFFPFTQIGRFTFDGAGNTSGFGFLKDRSGLHKTESKGTYKVKSNCTGTLTSEDGTRTFHIIIAHGGDEYYLIGTRKGVVGMGTGKKQ